MIENKIVTALDSVTFLNHSNGVHVYPNIIPDSIAERLAETLNTYAKALAVYNISAVPASKSICPSSVVKDNIVQIDLYTLTSYSRRIVIEEVIYHLTQAGFLYAGEHTAYDNELRIYRAMLTFHCFS